MSRLIDADVLREEVYSWGMNDYEPSDFTDAIDDAPTIEAISKADYEARLKADMAAMLTDIQSEIEEWRKVNQEVRIKFEKENISVVETIGFNNGISTVNRIIQEKINALGGNKNA